MTAKIMLMAVLLGASADAKMSNSNKWALEAAYIKGKASCFGSSKAEIVQASGWKEPCAGPPDMIKYAPTRATNASQINVPIGYERAGVIARAVNIKHADSFPPAMAAAFLSGGGVGGNKTWAEITRKSIALLTNTVGRPLGRGSILASYGLWVNEEGILMAMSNAASPCLQINEMLSPKGGYLTTWLRANNGTQQLLALYESAYTLSGAFTVACQQQANVSQLMANHQPDGNFQLGASVMPSAYITNFVLLYLIDHHSATKMPAYWQPIPSVVAAAISASPTGQVSWNKYKKYFD